MPSVRVSRPTGQRGRYAWATRPVPPSGVKYLCLRRSAKARTKMKFHENTLRGFTQTYMGASSLNTLLGIWTRFAMASFSASPVRPPSALSMVERDLKTGVRILPPISRGSMTW